ncbi:hypothetical protein AVEN_53477-1 [Araneus ventricosus]|uniref:Uncharacterized protein n=1 Tax=Araneus ventricosus TaxID=182803 RepID=A0A4Y2AC22_ARAVE|nr:hypothetical protein AVEN_53477-1 [Araneus ventricosus]
MIRCYKQVETHFSRLHTTAAERLLYGLMCYGTDLMCPRPAYAKDVWWNHVLNSLQWRSEEAPRSGVATGDIDTPRTSLRESLRDKTLVYFGHFLK